MHPVGLFNQGHMMKKIKMYITSLTTMDAELFKQIKMLATKLGKDQNDLLEETAQEFSKKIRKQSILAATEAPSECKSWRFLTDRNAGINCAIF